jgi:uncharacterized membrane protein
VALFRIVSAPIEPEPADELEIRAVAAERLTFFSDAVVAIAMTLLALDLPVPKGDTSAEFWHSALSHREDYLAFVIGFLVIGAHWRGHHRVFRYVTSVTPRLTSWNMAWLLMLVITPFATRVIAGDSYFPSRFTMYAGVQILAGLSFQAMLLEIKRNGLLRSTAPMDKIAASRFRSLAIALAWVVGIPLSYVTGWAYVVLVVVPIAGNTVGRRLHGPD